LISTVSKNQGQAVLLAVFYIMPTFVLSGAFTPIETQPPGLRHVALAFPLTYFCHGFRAAILQSSTFVDLRLDFVALVVFVLLPFGTSVLAPRPPAEAR